MVLYPNPVTAGQLNIGLEAKQAALLKCSITDVQGRLIRQLPERRVDAGKNELAFSTGSLAPGAYYFVVQQENDKKALARRIPFQVLFR